LHKRAYAEEATIQTASSSKPLEKTVVQPKKARFGESFPKGGEAPVTEVPATSVSQAVSAPTPVSTGTRTDMPSAQSQPPSTLQTPASASAASLSVDDSDEELPTLNIESDTDSEDEDDDVPMLG
jgi:pre-rRNA-processing protein RIX1